MRIVFSLSVFAMCSCGPLSDHHKSDKRSGWTGGVEPEFQPYVDQFEVDFEVSLDGVPVVWDDIEDDRFVGVCLTHIEDPSLRKVKIDKVKSKDLTEEQLEQLLYHEFGHCGLDLPHDDTTHVDDDDRPNSVMRSWMFNSLEARMYWKEYRQEYLEQMRDMRRNSPKSED